MNEKLRPLEAWRDDPHICAALDSIYEGRDPVVALVEALVGIAEQARYAEDYMIIHRLKCREQN